MNEAGTSRAARRRSSCDRGARAGVRRGRRVGDGRRRPTRTSLNDDGHARRRHEPAVQAADVPRREGQAGGLRRRAAEGAREADEGQAGHQEPRLQRPDPGPRREEVRHGLGRPLGHAGAQEGRSASAGRTCRTRRSSRCATSDTTPATIAAWNSSDKTITSLQGSTAEQLVQKTFPNATSRSFPDQNAAFLEVATGRADGDRRRELPARAVQQVERQQAEGGRRSRSRSTSSTARGRCRRATTRSPGTEQVHLQDAEERCEAQTTRRPRAQAAADAAC